MSCISNKARLLYVFRADPSWKSTPLSTRVLMSSNCRLTILHCGWVCLIPTLPDCVVLTFAVFTPTLDDCAARPPLDDFEYVLPRGRDLDQIALMVKRIRSLIVWAWWWIHKKVLVCLFVESSFITNISNSLLDRHYDCSLKHRRAFLLSSSWAFRAGGSCEGWVPLSQCYGEKAE